MSGKKSLPTRLVIWCRQWLGTAPVRRLFQTQHISLVTGLQLADGRTVVIKVRPPDERVAATFLVQQHLWQAGFPCPEPLAGPAPLGEMVATAERFVPGGTRLPHGSDSPALFARALARLVALAPPSSLFPALAPPPYWAQWDHGQAGSWPPDPDYDLNAHIGPPWLEELARRARERLLAAGTLPPIIGHVDWESQNLRWLDRRLHVVHDWDSAASRPEATLAGMAAMVFPASGHLNEQATLAQSTAFLDAYERARGVPWSDEERELGWAAGLWVQAFKAKKAARRGEGAALLAALAAEAPERLRRAGI